MPITPVAAEVYQRLGIPTVATVRWTADQIIRRLFPEGAQALWRDPTGVVDLVEVHVDEGWYGLTVSDLQAASGIRHTWDVAPGLRLSSSAEHVKVYDGSTGDARRTRSPRAHMT